MKATYTLTFDFGNMTKEEIENEIAEIVFTGECLDALIDNKITFDEEKAE